jgi:hypothetical protein
MGNNTPTANSDKITGTNLLAPRALENDNSITSQRVYTNNPVILAQASKLPSLRPKPKGAESDDDLSVLSPKEAVEWYRRLALHIRSEYSASLSAKMMLHWLDGKGNKLTFDSRYVEDIDFVLTYLRDEVRPVFLTEKKAKLEGGDRWGGILLRIKDPSWDGKPKEIFYEGPSVEAPLKLLAEVQLGLASKSQADLVTSLHIFGIKTKVIMRAEEIQNSAKYNVSFVSWESWVSDKYDWDPKEHFTVPNPDYGNPDGLAPDKIKVRVYHKNAKRVENANLAHPYPVESKKWYPSTNDIVGPAIVDSSRKL